MSVEHIPEAKCKHTSDCIIELDTPVIMWPDGDVRCIIYKCSKCGKPIYKNNRWDSEWREWIEKCQKE